MDSTTVQRPSPESSTHGAMPSNVRVLLQGVRRELEEPRPHDGALHPERGDLRVVEPEARRVEELEALRVRLHDRVLDPVVDHLHVMARPGRPRVEPAVLRGERRERRREAVDRLLHAAAHEAVPDREAPDPARRPGVHEEDSLLLQLRRASLRVVEVRVAAVHDEIAGREELRELVDHALRRGAGGHHDPDRAGHRELPDDVREARGAGRAVLHRRRDRVRAPRPGDDRVAAAQEPLHHVPAHLPEADESDLHGTLLRNPQPRAAAGTVFFASSSFTAAAIAGPSSPMRR